MGEALRRGPASGGIRRLALALIPAVTLATSATSVRAQYPGETFDRGRFSVIAESRDAQLARSLLRTAIANDTFPGLPRPRQRVLIVIAADARRFAEFAGTGSPEWGIAFAFPAERRIVMQGSSASSAAGDPLVVLRHELAHLVLHEYLGNLPPRWFDEGYATFAANEWGSDDVIATNIALALRGMPNLDALDDGFAGGTARASASYALAYRAVAELAALDPQRGLALLFTYWPATGSLDAAIRQAYGLTQSAFEKRWRDRTHQRYGALALATDFTVGILLMLFIVTPLYLARRQRDARRLAVMRLRDDDEERRARESAIEQLLNGLSPPDATSDQSNEPS